MLRQVLISVYSISKIIIVFYFKVASISKGILKLQWSRSKVSKKGRQNLVFSAKIVFFKNLCIEFVKWILNELFFQNDV